MYILECSVETAFMYSKLKAGLKAKGKPIPENDLWIAASAMQLELTLITRDGHFNHIDNLSLQQW